MLATLYPFLMGVLVAGFGNVLRADDGVGVVVAERLAADPRCAGALVLDVGIGGMRLVQELLASDVDLLVIVDAVDLGRAAGSVVVQRPDVLDVSTLSAARRRDELADTHLATPARALMMARGLGVLPGTTLIVGVQTTDTDEPREGLSETTERAVPVIIGEVLRLIDEHLGGNEPA